MSFTLSDLNFGNKTILFVYLVIVPLLFASCVTYNSSSKAKNYVFGKIESLSHSKIPKQIK